MRREALGAAVALLVAISFGVGYLAGGAGRSPTTTTSLQTTTAVTTVTATTTATVISGPPPGLELRVTDNASVLKVGQSLNVGVSLLNALATTNSVHTSQDWPFMGVPVSLWPTCYYPFAAYAVVLQGNYTLQALQSAANVTFNIVCTEDANVDHVVFQPGSSEANLTGAGFGPGGYPAMSNGTAGPFQLSLNFTTAGYWDLVNNSKLLNPPIIGELPSRMPIATPFVPGVYTVAVADGWGQATVLHVDVIDG